MNRASFLIVIGISTLLATPSCVETRSSLGNDSGGGGQSSMINPPPDATTIADCKAKTSAAGAHCADEPDRLCLYTWYDKECERERPAAIAAAMACFTTPVCHTFSDPGETEVADCQASVKTQFSSDVSKAVESAICNKCGYADCTSAFSGAAVPLYHLDDTVNWTIMDCVQGAPDCTVAEACVTSLITAYATCTG